MTNKPLSRNEILSVTYRLENYEIRTDCLAKATKKGLAVIVDGECNRQRISKGEIKVLYQDVEIGHIPLTADDEVTEAVEHAYKVGEERRRNREEHARYIGTDLIRRLIRE